MRFFQHGIVSGLLLFCLGCQDLTGIQTLGSDLVTPTAVKSAQGAYRMATSAKAGWQRALADYVVQSGVMTDELQSNDRGSLNSALDASTLNLLDARILTRDVTLGLYQSLHQIRGMARQAIGALAKYASDSSVARRGELYAFIGYAEVMLADLYCSGVPLSTWDFEADYTYHPSSTTTEVYQHAIALFDTALMLAADSLPIMYFARVGKGRALLAIGDFAAAGRAVDSVPAEFIHIEPVYTCGTPNGSCQATVAGSAKLDFTGVTVSNAEGGNAIIAWTNPRTAAYQTGTSVYGYPVYFPKKYSANNISNIMVASGTEAALIRAEAALYANDIPRWLEILNELRARSSVTDTMAAITDPGAATRADTMFAERAQWLFLSGHRQGDLRRRLRQDLSRAQQNVYPSGTYPGGIKNYGMEVTMPIESKELLNPLFHGCLDRRP